MNDYDYVNARVRGMSTTLLDRELYEQILAPDAEELLVDALLASRYAPQLREALAVRRGLAAAESAVRRQMHATFSEVRAFAPERPRRLLDVQLNLWEAANLLALVRGISAGASAEAIMESVLPVGALSEAELAELAAQPDLGSLADALATWGHRFSPELRRAIRAHGDPTDLPGLELALSRTYFAWALAEMRSLGRDARVGLPLLRMQIDLSNVRAALDHVRHRELAKAMDGFETLPGGMLSGETLERIAARDSLIAAFEVMEDTYFSPAIQRGILAYGGAGSLGVMERFLEMVVIERGCRLFRSDPVGAGVPLGFLWRVYNEFVNLRILIRGRAYRMPPNIIRQELLYV